jgi:hypothetical protein
MLQERAKDNPDYFVLDKKVFDQRAAQKAADATVGSAAEKEQAKQIALKDTADLASEFRYEFLGL